MSSDEEMRFLVAACRALREPGRLKMLGLLALRPRYGEELAEVLALAPATVSHHLHRLREGGLVRAVKQSPYVRYELEPKALERLRALFGSAAQWPEGFGLPSEEELTERALRPVLDEEGRVTEFPRAPRQRLLVLRWLALHFESGRIYPELEVRRILMEICHPSAQAQKELVKAGWLHQQGGVMRRTEGGGTP
jgi:DNA-binding transcriptional ArsR family regulator